MHYFKRTLHSKKSYSFLDQLIIFVKGILLGFFSFIPGVGPVSLTFILNIYNEFNNILININLLLRSLFSFFYKKDNKKDISKYFFNVVSDFSLPLYLGIFIGISVFTFIFSFFLFNLPSYIRAIFFGVVLASAFYVFTLVKNIDIKHKITFILSFIFFYLLLGYSSNNIFYAPSIFIVILTGLLSSLTLIIPGLGVSFFLIFFNVYHHFLDLLYALFYGQINTNQLIELLSFLVAFIIGFFGFFDLFKKFFNKYQSYYFIFISSAMFASLRLLYPYIRVKGDIVTYSKPFDLPIGHLLLVTIVTVMSFYITKFLSNYFNKK